MEIEFMRITTQADIEQLKFWLEDPELLLLARMRDTPLAQKDFDEYLKTLSYFILVDGLAVGYARIYTSDKPTEGEIGIVIALPEYRNMGIGTAVGKKLVATCLAIGMETIRYATADYNMPSIKLAERLGFKFDAYLPGAIALKTGPRNALVYKLVVT